MPDRAEVLIFGDLTGDFRTGLGRLAAGKDNVLLTSFFEQAAFVIRAELGTLSVCEREDKGFVQFTSIVDLLANLRDVSSPHPALEKALTCTHQFASFIRYVCKLSWQFACVKICLVAMLAQGKRILVHRRHASSVFVPACSQVQLLAAVNL